MWEFIIYVGIGFLFFNYAVPMFRKKFIKKKQICSICKGRYSKDLPSCPYCDDQKSSINV